MTPAADPAASDDDARVDARASRGLQLGSGNFQLNVYAEARSVRWPHRTGAVPILADCFQERIPEMRGLDEAVSAGRTAVLTQVLSGLGGVGKTQLAAAYARRTWDDNKLDLLVWATARSRDAALTSGARQLIEVGLYTPQQALAYLQEKTGDDSSPEHAADLAADLGYLPLALAQAAAYLRDRQETYAGYRRRLHDRRKRLAELFPADALADDYRSTVAATWSISLEAADRLIPHGLATPVLRLASTLDPNGAPVEVFTTPAALTFLTDQHQPADPVEEHDCRDALSNLHRFNLISVDRAGGPRAVRTHALVQRATLDQLPADALAATVRTAADAVLAAWPTIERNTDLGQALRDCAVALKERHGVPLWDPDAHPVLFRAGRSLGERGLVSAAVRYWTQLTTEATDTLGADHPHTLTTRSDLASCRGEAGDPVGAAAAFEELLNDYLRVLGADHPHTLITRGNLANWRGEAGDPVGAAAAFEELLNDSLRVLGADHPDTLAARRSLAYWRGVAGDPVGAAAALEELLNDCLRVLGADHPHTLTVRRDLAYWRERAHDQGQSR